MTQFIERFIQENIDMIDQNRWEELYDMLYQLHQPELRGEFNKIMIDAGIDPAAFLGYVPENYLRGSNIEQYTIPSNVEYIAHEAFRDCLYLEHVDIPEGVTAIHNLAFESCRFLTSVVLPASLKEIGLALFWNCSSLYKLQYNGTQQQAFEVFKLQERRSAARHFGSFVKQLVCTDGIIQLQKE